MSVGFVALGVIYTIWEGRNQARMRRDAATKREEHDGTVNDITVAQLKTTIRDLAKAVKAAADSLTKHDRDCIALKTELVGMQKQLLATSDRHERAIEQLQSQVRMTMTGGSDKIIEIKG